MNLPAPTEFHRKLLNFVGDWGGEEELHDDTQWAVRGSLAGRSTVRVALDGLAVVADYEQSRNGRVTFRGHGLVTYDTEKASYVLHWFGRTGGRILTLNGDFSGEVLTLAMALPPNHFRLSCDLVDTGQLQSRLERSDDGENWRLLFQGTYRRSH